MKLYFQDADTKNISASISRLQYLVDTIPGLVKNIPESDFSHKRIPEVWSKKEILGHLIDSATNNHQRFIRIQYENNPVIGYDQNEWNALTGYNELNSNHIIDFWAMYNQHLVYILKLIPSENMGRTGLVLDGKAMTLAWYINDYVAHMEHHLRDIVKY